VRAAFDHIVYALKVIPKSQLRWGPDPVEATYEDMLEEVAVMRKLRHPFLVPLLASFQTPDRLFLVMPFYSGGEVFTLMKTLVWKEEALRVHAAQMALALDYIHGRNLVYRDMKPENVLLDRAGNCVLADFGLVVPIGTPARGCRIGGTPAYMAPEVYKCRADAVAGPEGDWWGYGLVLFEMATGVHPFMRPDGTVNPSTAHLEGPNLLAHADGLGDAFLDLELGLLDADPAQRLFGKQALADHPFFDGLDWAGVLSQKVRPHFDGKDWGTIVREMFQEEGDRFDPLCGELARFEVGPSGDHLPGYEYVSDAFLPKLRR